MRTHNEAYGGGAAARRGTYRGLIRKFRETFEVPIGVLFKGSEEQVHQIRTGQAFSFLFRGAFTFLGLGKRA